MEMKCCGANGPKDYTSEISFKISDKISEMNVSCCELGTSCQHIYEVGCLAVLEEELRYYFRIASVIFFTSSVIHFGLAIVTTCSLYETCPLWKRLNIIAPEVLRSTRDV